MQKKFVAACCAAAAALSALGAMPAVVPAFAAGMRGDTDGDGRIGLSDVKLLRDFLVGGGSLGGDADMNQDGRLNAKDLTLLKRKAMGLGGGSSAGLVINEVCSTNKTSLKAADGTSPDWIELFNGGDTAVDLSGIGVSDGAVNKYKFTFASGTTLAAGGYLIIFCDDRDAGAPEYHAAFKISASGETVYLTAADGTEIDSMTVPDLETDVTYGRYTNGSSDLALLKPTPGKSNDAAEVVYRVEPPVFSQEGGFYDAGFQLSLSDETGNSIYYTLDGSDPRTSSTAKQYQGAIGIRNNTSDANKLSAIKDISLRPYTVPDYNVDKGMVIRAVCKDSKGAYSAVATNSYFVGKTASYYTDMKVLSISTDSSNFFDSKTGIYVIGDQYYQWKNSGSFDPDLDVGSCDNPTNYNSEGREWERPCNIQVFEQGKLKFTEDVGVRISGNWTTAFPQKSLTFYARRDYGANKMQYDFFERAAVDVDGARIKEYKKVTLRNGGNGFDNARFRDDLNQELAAGLHLGTQAKCDYIVFLDGEFWGYYSMQEKLDENYIESHYHVDANNVAGVKVGEQAFGSQAAYSEFRSFWSWAMSADLSNASNYQRVCNTLDIEGLIDFVAFESYIVNWDCMINDNNWMIWRAEETDADNPYADGRWRFLLYDTEYSSGYDGQCGLTRDYFKRMNNTGKDKCLDALFLRLMKNSTFKQKFYDTCLRIYKETFDPTAVSAKIDRYAAALDSAVTDTFRRFDVGADFRSNVKIVRNFFSKRQPYAIHHLNLLCGVADQWQDDANLIDQYGWSIWMNDGAGTIAYEDDGSITVNVTRTGQYAQVSSGSVEMTAGKTYRITYTIRTSQNVNTYVMFQEGSNDYTSYYYQDRTFTPQAQTFTDTVTMTQSDENVKFLIGLDKGTGTYYISNFSMVCVN